MRINTEQIAHNKVAGVRARDHQGDVVTARCDGILAAVGIEFFFKHLKGGPVIERGNDAFASFGYTMHRADRGAGLSNADLNGGFGIKQNT